LRLKLPDKVCLAFLPVYCPELNPSERLWRDLKDDLAWQQSRDGALQET
jgi:putative transposase